MTQEQPILSYVDPFIGTEPSGNCLPGPYLPFSLVKLGPDVLPPHSTNGYDTDSPIIRFSHTHVSGTGGGGRYGNIGIIPFTGLVRDFNEGYERENEHAELGYYSVHLQPANIQAELTVTPRVGFHRYRFATDKQNHLMIDLGAVIQCGGKRTPGMDLGISTGGYVQNISDYEAIGRADLKGGWGHSYPYSIYFYAKFDQAADKQHTGNRGMLPAENDHAVGPNAYSIFSFSAEEVNLQVGISFVSVAKARASVEREAAGKSFENAHTDAADIWETALERIKIEGGSQEQRTIFYSLFSKLLTLPIDCGVDDENPLWESGVRYFTEYYALWDSVRNTHGLLTLIDPQLQVDMLNNLLDIAEHRGWLPDAWVAHHNAQIQGGSSADILYTEAALKGLKGIDFKRALEFMRKNAEIPSPDPWHFGRHWPSYQQQGFVSTDVKNCVSRHLEYAYQDWCIGRMAQLQGDLDLAWRYFDQSKRIWNLWHEEHMAFAPKRPDGKWEQQFDPAVCKKPDTWNDPYFYEGNSIEWSVNVHHDFPELVERCGGKVAFIDWLDRHFEHHYSKETMLHSPYLYIYAGRPDLTNQRVHECLNHYFKAERKGLHDNEDMGCQSSFYMAASMGIYPVMGQDIYWLNKPVFTKSSIKLGESNKVLTIICEEAESNKQHITGITINGKAIDRVWLRHREIMGGAEIVITLGDESNGFGEENLPPSPMLELK